MGHHSGSVSLHRRLELVTTPLTPAWDRNRKAEDATKEPYTGSGADEPVIWFKQTIGHACGPIGLLHSAINGPAVSFIKQGFDLLAIRNATIPLGMDKRAEMLLSNEPFERAHKFIELDGGRHYTRFVKSHGKLWELEGTGKGPLERGILADDKDVLSPRALEMGLRRIIELNAYGGGESLLLRCIALARRS
ncbi:hypothetical protein BJX68DRAFT_267322 [Aspergillus pseudodeflectus]|uniref:ubiquitinyl hydrolase 1 n=1 Tax=Aspergillus pseudodeflectus TaxID=176178 RepID=A0ABR4K9P3_9EURO